MQIIGNQYSYNSIGLLDDLILYRRGLTERWGVQKPSRHADSTGAGRLTASTTTSNAIRASQTSIIQMRCG